MLRQLVETFGRIFKLGQKQKLKEKYDYIYEGIRKRSGSESVRIWLRESWNSGADNRYDMVKQSNRILGKLYHTLSPDPYLPEEILRSISCSPERGYCTYYATAMTVMLRSLGIPARYVEGFITKEENKIGKYIPFFRRTTMRGWKFSSKA